MAELDFNVFHRTGTGNPTTLNRGSFGINDSGEVFAGNSANQPVKQATEAFAQPRLSVGQSDQFRMGNHGLLPAWQAHVGSADRATSSDHSLRLNPHIFTDVRTWLSNAPQGVYYGDGAGIANAPTGDWYQFIGIRSHNPLYQFITAYSMTGAQNLVFTCENRNGVWTRWKMLAEENPAIEIADLGNGIMAWRRLSQSLGGVRFTARFPSNQPFWTHWGTLPAGWRPRIGGEMLIPITYEGGTNSGSSGLSIDPSNGQIRLSHPGNIIGLAGCMAVWPI
jgi:hypothetical protein